MLLTFYFLSFLLFSLRRLIVLEIISFILFLLEADFAALQTLKPTVPYAIFNACILMKRTPACCLCTYRGFGWICSGLIQKLVWAQRSVLDYSQRDGNYQCLFSPFPVEAKPLPTSSNQQVVQTEDRAKHFNLCCSSFLVLSFVCFKVGNVHYHHSLFGLCIPALFSCSELVLQGIIPKFGFYDRQNGRAEVK